MPSHALLQNIESEAILSPLSPSLPDLTHNATYLAACRVGGSLVKVKDIPIWDRRNETSESNDVESSESTDGNSSDDDSGNSTENAEAG